MILYSQGLRQSHFSSFALNNTHNLTQRLMPASLTLIFLMISSLFRTCHIKSSISLLLFIIPLCFQSWDYFCVGNSYTLPSSSDILKCSPWSSLAHSFCVLTLKKYSLRRFHLNGTGLFADPASQHPLAVLEKPKRFCFHRFSIQMNHRHSPDSLCGDAQTFL